GWKLKVGGGSYNAYQLFFVLAWLARTSTALLVFRIREPGASSIPKMLRALNTRNRVVAPLEPERPAPGLPEPPDERNAGVALPAIPIHRPRSDPDPQVQP